MKKTSYLLLTLLIFACNKKADETKITTNFSIENNQSVEQTDTIDLSAEEDKLLKIHNDILAAMGNDRNDSLLVLNSHKFTDSLTYLIKNNNSTLNYPFEKLQKENVASIVSSADKKLRVYSWNTHLGGTMRFFNQIYQFDANGTIMADESLASNDPQASFSKIYTVQNKNNENIYLVISNSILSSKYSVQHINAYKIGTENLQNATVFKTKTNTLDQISVEYDFFSVVVRPERPVELITLENNTLKIALVDDNQNVTSKNLIYEWNGDVFLYKGVK
ncbi:hypothetical protein NU10_09395 [Flavobacterium dauae]|uniref:hypothetical protein n=1 Tax=Flavobacterium dauae TaxID=1563479 RepID=UPI00101B4E29|nr:hypothetical protein [Flavobacterium dauae]WLD22934.1 hypothetical protein NU10_09395 [Flavobacterium dauae]